MQIEIHHYFPNLCNLRPNLKFSVMVHAELITSLKLAEHNGIVELLILLADPKG